MTEMKHLQSVVIDADSLGLSVWGMDEDFKKKLGIEHLSAADVILLVKNAKEASALFNEIGLKGGYYTKEINGKAYVILTGYPGLRKYLKGTKYLPQNPKVVKFGIGPVAQSAAKKVNFIISMTTYTGIDVVKYISGDGITLSEVTGNAIFNAASTWLSLAVATAVTAGVGTITTLALPGVLAGLAAGALVSGFAASINEDLQLSAKLAQLIEKTAGAVSENKVLKGAICQASVAYDGSSSFGWDKICRPPKKPKGSGSGTGTGTGTGTETGDNESKFDDDEAVYDGYEQGTHHDDGSWEDQFGNDWDAHPSDEDYNPPSKGQAPPEVEVDLGGGGMLTTPIDPVTGEPIGPTTGDETDWTHEINVDEESGS